MEGIHTLFSTVEDRKLELRKLAQLLEVWRPGPRVAEGLGLHQTNEVRERWDTSVDLAVVAGQNAQLGYNPEGAVGNIHVQSQTSRVWSGLSLGQQRIGWVMKRLTSQRRVDEYTPLKASIVSSRR